jgi:hypothetical protein
LKDVRNGLMVEEIDEDPGLHVGMARQDLAAISEAPSRTGEDPAGLARVRNRAEWAAGRQNAEGRTKVGRTTVARANGGSLPLLCPRSHSTWFLRKRESNPWRARSK